MYLRKIAVEPVFIALAADHPLASSPQPRLADLAAERWFLSPSDGAGPLRHLITTRGVLSPCRVTFPESADITVRSLEQDPLRIRYPIGWRDDGIFGDRPDALVADAVAAHRASTEYRRWSARRGNTRV